jgi:hypothetical protein
MKNIFGFNKWVLFFGFILLAGCASPYKPAPQILPSHVKKIFIKPIINNTTQYGLEEKLMLRLVDEFVRDGRLEVVNTESLADAALVVEVNRYILQPLTYDANLVTQQYKLWILLNVYFIDKVNNVTLWAEPNMEGIQIYYDSTLPGGMTEEEARQIIWDNISRDIIKRTIEGFGSVTGASEKKVPK